MNFVTIFPFDGLDLLGNLIPNLVATSNVTLPNLHAVPIFDSWTHYYLDLILVFRYCFFAAYPVAVYKPTLAGYPLIISGALH